MEGLIEAAKADAYGESEQRAGFLKMMEDRLKLPFEAGKVLAAADERRVRKDRMAERGGIEMKSEIVTRTFDAKGRRRGRTRRRQPARSATQLDRLIAAATVDAYGESEQRTGFLTMLEDRLKLPFETTLLGVGVLVERIDLSAAEEIVAICRRGRNRQAFPILELPLPTPLPPGAEWIEAYRRWAQGK